MNSFQTIVHNVVNLRNNPFSYNYVNDNKGIHKIFYLLLTNNHLSKMYKNKFKFFYETINNFYFSEKPDEKNIFINYFYKIQKTYHALNRFCYNYKLKYANLVVDTDLQLNKIHLTDKNVIRLYHNRNQYLFKIEDLLKMIYTCLTNTHHFFIEPIVIKNPYNNMPFEKYILYNIYFYLKYKASILTIKMDHIDLFIKFANCNFNMTKFVIDYEHILREFAIKNYLNNTSALQLKQDIKIMLSNFNYNRVMMRQIRVDKDFPTEELIHIMKPYLYLHLKQNYSLIETIRIECKHRLAVKLTQFQSFNPHFGRKIIRFQTQIVNGNEIKKYYIEYNKNYKKYNVCNTENFMRNHLSYNYRNIDYENDEDEIESENIIISTNRMLINDNNDNDNDNNNDNEYDYDEADDNSVS